MSVLFLICGYVISFLIVSMGGNGISQVRNEKKTSAVVLGKAKKKLEISGAKE